MLACLGLFPIRVQNCLYPSSLRKHDYSNILKIYNQKGKSLDKKSDIFHIPVKNIACGTR